MAELPEIRVRVGVVTIATARVDGHDGVSVQITPGGDWGQGSAGQRLLVDVLKVALDKAEAGLRNALVDEAVKARAEKGAGGDA
jgi:hypothetical protein